MTILYRCSKRTCQQRRSLRHHHTWYIREPKCIACGTPLTYVDKWQMKKNKESICKCGAFHYPHRAGSNIYCVEFKGELTQEQINEFNEYHHGQLT